MRHNPDANLNLANDPAKNGDQRAQLMLLKEQEAQDKQDQARVIGARQNFDYDRVQAGPPQKHGKLELMGPASLAKSREAFERMSEGQLYGEIVDRYQARDQWGFEARAHIYLSKFDNSDRRDEVMYMQGLNELGERNYGPALVQFNRILRDHPNGRKAPAALFAKGMTFRKMNLLREAKRVLADVSHDFPGSPESIRAKAELKVIK